VADKKISELTALTGALNTADALAIVDDSASQTKKISPKELLERSFILIDDDSIPAAKVDGLAIADGSVTTAKLADSSVTAAKLANNSSGVVGSTLPGSGVRVGQVALETTGGKFYCWDGSQWVAVKAAGSVNTITTTTGGLLEVVITQTGDSVNIIVEHADTTGAAQFLAGPTAAAGAVSARVIIGDDLPTAGASTKGAVTVTGDGLRVDGDHLEIDNDISPSNGFQLGEFNSKGLAIDTRAIAAADLPIATDTTNGVVKPGADLGVSADGTINPIDRMAGGTYTKLTVNNAGIATAGSVLSASDIPDLSADQITSGQLPPSVIGDRSITEIKLADYSTCLVQEGAPSGDYKLGQLWFTPSTSQLRVYGRGSSGDLWLSVGFGALQAQNLRWAGTVNADTSTITTLTDIGISEGLTAGGPIPTPSDELSGLYFVVDTAGSSITIPNVNGDLCTEGDWILYIDQAQGAIHLDISAGGGGGGGGASKLNDLTDVDLNTVEDDQLLQYDSITGMWKNVSLISGGTF